MSLTSPTAAEIKAFRLRHGMTQQTFAEQFGVSKRAIEQWEGNINSPAPYIRFAFAWVDHHGADHPAEPGVLAGLPPEAPKPLKVDLPYVGDLKRKPMQKGAKR